MIGSRCAQGAGRGGCSWAVQGCRAPLGEGCPGLRHHDIELRAVQKVPVGERRALGRSCASSSLSPPLLYSTAMLASRRTALRERRLIYSFLFEGSQCSLPSIHG